MPRFETKMEAARALLLQKPEMPLTRPEGVVDDGEPEPYLEWIVRFA